MPKHVPSRIAPFAASAALLAGAATAQAEVTGNIGAVSQYIFRGGVEDSRTALQGGLDYGHDSGLYAGTWFSTLDYGAPNNNEVDLYAGYSGSAGDFGYDLGLLYFLYTGNGEGDSDANTPEAYVAGSYGPVGLSVNYALDDSTWTNQGDVYVKLSFEQALPREFTFAADAGYYFYESDGEFITGGTEDGAFRDATVSLSHPLAATGADMSLNYTWGGSDRFDSSGDGYLDNHFWAGATWTF
ncbi:hypothetical protein AN478_03900 [Thiohalorhabdus denitrificans]|uniref:Uncharacterized protein n=1 Tax=Thiohalorhabdus denitrificans TaxID=381306 RepID=A0A0P9CPR5_9GAMM|nr:TorF family putative porin [Thiohalorhabdus denitrificans]KPV41075.1 hypothetical protein AN478_03900 [Thiohalorhabdus denitrificans]SCY39613.1 conserved hypothetical protein [Thiohalorhabdus denitrificans]